MVGCVPLFFYLIVCYLQALLNDNFLDLNESDDVSEPWYSSIVRGEVKVSRVCFLTAGTVLVGVIILGWTALALSKSTKSLHRRDSFKESQRSQQSDWGKSAGVAQRRTRGTYHQKDSLTGKLHILNSLLMWRL